MFVYSLYAYIYIYIHVDVQDSALYIHLHTHIVYYYIVYTVVFNGHLNECVHLHMYFIDIYIYIIKVTRTRPPDSATKKTSENLTAPPCFRGANDKGI